MRSNTVWKQQQQERRFKDLTFIASESEVLTEEPVIRHRLGGYIAIGPAHLVQSVETTSSNNITIFNMFMKRDFILDKTGL